MTTQEPASTDPLINYQVHVTPEQVADLTKSVDKLHHDLRTRGIGFLIALIGIVALGIVLGVVTYQTRTLAACQSHIIDQNRHQLDAQDELFNVVNDPKASAEQISQATLNYQGIIRADKSKRDAAQTDNC